MAEVLKEEEESKESGFIPYIEDDFIPYKGNSGLDKQITLDPETDYKVEFSPIIETEFSAMGGGSTFKDAHVQADMEELKRRNNAIEAAVWGMPRDKATLTKLSKTILHSPLTPRTNGEAVATAIKTIHPPSVVKKIGEGIDTVVGKRAHTHTVLKNLDETGSYTEFMNRPDEGAVAAGKIVAKNNSKALAKIDEEVDSYSYSKFLDTLEYVNPLGGEDEKGQEAQFWETTKRIVTGDISYSEIDNWMESNYGGDWERRWAWWLAKEVAVDAALLGLAMTYAGAPLAGFLKAGRTATLGARFKAAMGRAVVVGVGGGSIQAGQNMALGRQEDFFSERTAYEMGGRAVGFAGAEALTRVAAKGISAASRGVANITGKTKREAIAAAAKDANVKPISEAALSKITSKHEFEGSPSSVIILNSLQDKVKNYSSFINNTSEKILERKSLEVQGMGRDIRNSLSDLLGIERGAIDNIEIDMLLPDITKMGNRFDKWAKDLPAFKNQNALSQGFSTRLYGLMRGQFENGSKDFELYLGDAGLVLRREDIGIATTKGSMIGKALKAGRLGEPAQIAFQSATNYLTARNFTNRVANGLKLMYDDATKGLGKKDLAVLDKVLKEGNADHVVYAKGVLTPTVDMSPKLWEAYAKMRFALDMGYEILDKAKVNAFKGSLKDIKYGKVFKTKDGYIQIASKKPLKGGQWQARKFDNTSFTASSDKEVLSVLPSAMEEITTIVPYRNGHIPRVYNPHKYSVVVISPGKGQVSREALFDSSKEAAEYVKIRNSEGYKNNDEIVISITNNAETGFGGFRMGRSDLNLLDMMSEGEQKTLTSLLEKRGIDSKDVRFMLDVLGPRNVPGGHHNPLTDLGTAVSKEGKRLRLELAKLKASGKSQKAVTDAIKDDLKLNTLPPREAIVDYFGTVAHSAGYDNWRIFALDDFTQRFGDILQAGSTYAKPVFDKTHSKYSYVLEQQARRYGKWLERNITQKTGLEKRIDRGVGDWSRHLGQLAAEKNSFAANTMAKLADGMPIVNQVYGTLRFIAASPKLLTLNIPQLAIQASQALITVSSAIAKNPVTASRAITKLPMMGMLHTYKKLGKEVPASFKKTDVYKAYEDLVKSGYASDLYTSDTLFGMRNSLDPSIGRKFVDRLKIVGAAPFRGGEAINRVSAFLTVREQTLAAIKSAARKTKGKNLTTYKDYETALGSELYKDVLGFDGKPMTMADIGSQQFREAIVDKAQVLALNMAKSGQLEAMSGLGSVLLQFKQVLPKQLSLFDSSRLTYREKFAAAGGLLTFWGGAGVPLAADVLNLADYSFYKLKGTDPTERFYVSDHAKAFMEVIADGITDDHASSLFAQTLAKRGAIAAFSDDEVNIISRVALGSFVTDMIDIQSPGDFVVSFAVLNDMIDAVNRIAGADKIDIGVGAAAGGAIYGKKGAIIGAASAKFLLNPISYMELLSRFSSGEDFGLAVSKQFEPDSAIGKYLADETTWRSATLEVIRETGKVYSQLGSWSRIADAEMRYAVNPDAHMYNPLAPKTYVSSTLRGIPVEQNDFRDFLLKIGFMPGKIVNEYNRQDTQRAYNSALSDYKKKVSDDYRTAFGDDVRQKRIREDAAHILYKFRMHMESLNLDHNVPSNIYGSLIDEWLRIEGHAFTGGKMK